MECKWNYSNFPENPESPTIGNNVSEILYLFLPFPVSHQQKTINRKLNYKWYWSAIRFSLRRRFCYTSSCNVGYIPFGRFADFGNSLFNCDSCRSIPANEKTFIIYYIFIYFPLLKNLKLFLKTAVDNEHSQRQSYIYISSKRVNRKIYIKIYSNSNEQ